MHILTLTADGSNTLFNEQIGEHYHSKHGALQESKHVFIEAGLKHCIQNKNSIHILEIGFGTGLNFLLTLEHCLKNNIQLNYTSLEAYPLDLETLVSTGYENYVEKSTWDLFYNNYTNALNNKIKINDHITLEIVVCKLEDYQNENIFDLIYYDAFSVQHQPELWTDEIIAHTASFLKNTGVFVTYAITGKLKRALKACNCTIEKLPGAPGKREMLRATKID